MAIPYRRRQATPAAKLEDRSARLTTLSTVREITVQCLLLIIPRSVMATLTRRPLFLERC